MENYDSIFAPKENTGSKSFTPFDKNAWVEKKQVERQSAYAMIDETAEAMAQDGEVFKACMDVMARFDRYSVGNVLLIASQLPEATKLADFDTWKQSRCFIKRGETGIILLEPGEEYQREDGSFGVNYNVKRVFDISQTTSRQTVAQVSYDMRLLLKALLHNAPCAVEISDKVPDGVGAVYSSEDHKILVRQGMDGPDIFRSLVQELAHAHLDKGKPYNRADHAFTAYCTAYTMCKRYGIDTNNFSFRILPEAFGTMDAQAIRNEVSRIRETANQISADMSRVLSDRQKDRGKDAR